MSLTPEQTDRSKTLLKQGLEAACHALMDMLGFDVSLGELEHVNNSNWDALPDRFEADNPLMATFTLADDQVGMLLLKQAQASVLSDFMLGGAGAPDADTQLALSDMQLSAVSEAISQGLARAVEAIALATGQPLEASLPQVQAYSDDERLEKATHWLATPLWSVHGSLQLNQGTTTEELEFILIVEEDLCGFMAKSEGKATPAAKAPSPAAQVEDALADMNDLAASIMQRAQARGATKAPAGVGQPTQAPTGASAQPVTVQPVQFGSFDQQPNVLGEEGGNLGLLLDIRLNLTVELGRTKLTIKEVLELTRGSIISLDRVAGEAVDLYANGKLIARGEVVVIEDNFGLRITTIVSPADRLKTV
jgi:flagellar motor switch protein FliN/FliY